MSTHLPAPKEIRDLLVDLLGREVTLTSAPPLAPTSAQPCSIGVYVDDHLQMAALVVADLAFSARAGAAIGLLPAPQAEEVVAGGTLEEGLAENFHEVLNILASLFNAPGATHLRLHATYAAGTPIDPPLLARALTLGRREDLHLDLAGYGAGRLSFVLL